MTIEAGQYLKCKNGKFVHVLLKGSAGDYFIEVQDENGNILRSSWITKSKLKNMLEDEK